MWETEVIELGRVPEKTSQTVLFKFKQPLPDNFKIKNMSSSCGCSVPKEIKEGIQVTYTPAAVPPQMENGEYNTFKIINVWTNKEHFRLELKATIYKKK
jgi:hypothetical protein